MEKTIFLSVFPPYRGGISDFSERTALAVRPFVDIEALNFKRQYPTLLFPGKTQMSSVPSEIAQNSSFHPYSPLHWRRALLAIQSKKPTSVLFSYWHPFFAPAFLYLMKNLGPEIQKVGLIHNVLPHDGFPLASMWSKKFLDSLDLGITLSEGMHNAALNLAPNFRIYQLFHPLPHKPETRNLTGKQFFLHHFLKKGTKVFSHLGLVRPYKGVDIFIESALKVLETRSDVRFIIAGEFYDNPDKYMNMIPADKMHYFFVENRFLTELEMIQLIANSDAVVLPYRSGTQSGVLAQSLAQSTPIICSDIPGLSMYVDDAKTGLIFKRESVDDLAGKIHHFVDDFEPDMKRFREVQQRWSWESFGKAMSVMLKK